MKKTIPIGISDFKELIEGKFYYVDKSLIIKQVHLIMSIITLRDIQCLKKLTIIQ